MPRLMRNHGERVSGSNLSQTQSHLLSESGCFLSNRSRHRLGIARMLNKERICIDEVGGFCQYQDKRNFKKRSPVAMPVCLSVCLGIKALGKQHSSILQLSSLRCLKLCLYIYSHAATGKQATAWDNTQKSERKTKKEQQLIQLAIAKLQHSSSSSSSSSSRYIWVVD